MEQSVVEQAVVERSVAEQAVAEQRIWRHARDLGVVGAPDGSRFAVLDLNASQPVVLEGTAAAIWELIDGVRTEAGILQELGEAYGVDEDELRSAVGSFLSDLEGQRLIES